MISQGWLALVYQTIKPEVAHATECICRRNDAEGDIETESIITRRAKANSHASRDMTLIWPDGVLIETGIYSLMEATMTVVRPSATACIVKR